jgi:DNA mismatch endonuclease (patch repair protein)
MRSRRVAILVHGCFWHLHQGCALARVPSSQPEYWPRKLQRNYERDQSNQAELESTGWRVLVIWECETKNPDALRQSLKEFLGTS